MSFLPRRRARATLAHALLALLPVLAACSTFVEPRDVAGTYVLEQFDGRDPAAAGVTGEVVLRAVGVLERRLRFDAASETISVGEYRLLGNDLEVLLWEDGGRGEQSWSPQATLVGPVLTLRYGNPLDGPDIVEVYRKR